MTVKVGEIYVSPRGRCYKVLCFEQYGRQDVVLWNVTFEREERAISRLMSPENGWRVLRALPDAVTGE